MALVLRTKKKEYCVEVKDGKGYKNGKTLAKFYGHPMLPAEINELLDDHREKEWDAPDDRSKKERFVDYNFLAITHDRVDKTILRWEGVTDATGKNLDNECTRKNKIFFFEYMAEVCNFVMGEFDAIGKKLQFEKEDESGNSESSHAG